MQGAGEKETPAVIDWFYARHRLCSTHESRIGKILFLCCRTCNVVAGVYT